MRKLLLIATALTLSHAGYATARQASQATKPAESQASQPQQNAAARPRAQSRRDRTITGRVIDDGSQPVEGAVIVMFPAGLTNTPQGPAMMAKMRFISSDENGKFAAENLSPGAYKLMTILPGYVLAPDADENPQQKYYRPGDSLTIRMLKGGVITGTVTAESGEPVVGVRVRPVRVRDLKGKPARPSALDAQYEWKTDDRGIYRMYGLDPGVYVVAAGGKGLMPFATGAYDGDSPTYYPSATPNTASEVTVHSAEEITGIDIRYRDQRAHAITGTITTAGTNAAIAVAAVMLSDASTKALLGLTVAPMASGSHRFAFDGVSDGEYIITAISSDYTAGTVSHRIAVKGADTTGIDLLLSPFGSIEGRVVLEPAPVTNAKIKCEETRASTVEEIVMLARHDEKLKDKARLSDLASLLQLTTDANPSEKGEFKAGMLEASRYRLDFRLPSENWFVRSITLPGEKPGSPPKDAGRDGFTVKAGEHVKEATVTVAEGAARLRGKVSPATEGARLPDRLRVHLVPAEKESADDVLRYYEAEVEGGDAFTMTNLAPGKYWVLARPVDDEDVAEWSATALAWNEKERRKLRAQAEQSTATVELQRCQRVADYVLRYAPPKKVAAEKKPQ